MRHFGTRKHHRQSTRLPGYDYSHNGLYFVTICSWRRECVFGEIVNGEMRLNELGEIVLETWHELPYRFPDIQFDQFVVMPNHVHGIIHIVGAPLVGAPNQTTNLSNKPKHQNTIGNQNRGNKNLNWAGTRPAPTLGRVVGVFKSISAVQYIKYKRLNGSLSFHPLWQRNYHDHIIRNERSLNKIREYIVQNPPQWDLDRNNPKNINSATPPSPEPFRSDTSLSV